MVGRSRIAVAFGGVGALLVGISFGAGAAFAYSQEQQDACTGDAMRLCSAFIPDVDRITACMIQNKTQLTPRCAVYFQPPMRAGLAPSRARRPQSLKPPIATSNVVKPRKSKAAGKRTNSAER